MKTTFGCQIGHAIARSMGRAIAVTALFTTLSASGAAAAPGEPPAEIRLERNARKRTVRLEVGPVRLQPNLGYDAAAVPVSAQESWGFDGWLRSFDVSAVDASGRLIDATLIHHAALLAPGERDLFSGVTRRIVAFGMETEEIRLPGQLGYRVHPRDSVTVIGALFNPTDRAFDAVYLRIDITYADARHDAAHQSVLPMFLDVVGSGVVSFDAPPGESTRSWEWRPAIAGRALALGGHLHEYGVSVSLEDVTTGEVLWVAEAEHDADGKFVGVSRKIFPRGHRLLPDHVYRVTAMYRNPTNDPIPGAMGHIGGLFLPDRIEDMPPANPTDHAYVADLEARTASEHGAGHHAH